MSSASAPGNAPVALERSLRSHLSYAVRWLRAEVDDVVRIEPNDRGTAADPSPSLISGLLRWRTRLHSRRAVALARRWLLLALAAGVLLELIGLAAGAGRGTRTLWLIGPALLWLACVAVGLRRRRPGVGDVARLLDHDLALADVVSTALELEQRPSAASEPAAPLGLPALVLADGAAAVARSLGKARIASKSGWPERVAPAALVGVVALLIALPSTGSGAARSGVAARPGATAPAGSARARGAASSGTRPVARPAATRTGAPRTAAAHRSTVVRARSGRGGAQVSTTPSQAPATPGGKSTTGSVPQRSAGVRGAGAARGAGVGHAGAAGRSGGAAQPASGSGRASSSHRAAAGAPGGAAGSRAGAGAASVRGHAGAPSAPRKSGAASSNATAGLAAHHGAAGGASAGRARGSSAAGAGRPASGSANSTSRLPIQTGYGPSAGNPAKAGSGPEIAGGHGPAQSAAVSGAAGLSATIFPYIPPTPSLLPSFDLSPVLGYFGPFSLLLPATWQ